MSWLIAKLGNSLADGPPAVIVIAYFRETRGNVVLSKRAARLRKETGDDRYQCRADKERESLAILIKTGIRRPLWFFFSESIGKCAVRCSYSPI